MGDPTVNRFRRWTERFGRIFLAAAAAGASVSIPNVAMGDLPVAELFFASVTEPIGVAVSPGELLVTRPWCGNPRQIVSIGPTGVVSPFATLPSVPEGACREEYIAIAPAAADFLNTKAVADPLVPNRVFTPNESGFSSGFVYVTQGAKIIKIAPDGSAQTTFTTLSPCGDSHTGITFDRVGSFGYRLIATCNNGNVWAVDKSGTASAIGTIDAAGPFEGPDVAPNGGFSSVNGQLLVASENAGKVFAVSSAGVTSPVATINTAEGAAVIPSTVCSFGSSGGAYFSAVFAPPGSISKVPKSAFTGLSGALVRTESGATALLSSNGTTLNTTPTTFSSSNLQHEGASFCIDSVPTNLTGFIRREPDPINPGAGGVITVFFFPIPGIFNPFTVTEFRGGVTGTEQSFAFCTPNPAQGGARDCKFYKNKLGITTPNFRGTLHFNVVYHGPEGGSDAGGCG